MMQKAMSVRRGDAPPPQLINRMLAGNFKAMEALGEPVMRPFLQVRARGGAVSECLPAYVGPPPC